MECPSRLVRTWILIVCAENSLYSFIPLDIYGLKTALSETGPLCLSVYNSPDSIFRDVRYLCLPVQFYLINTLTISGFCVCVSPVEIPVFSTSVFCPWFPLLVLFISLLSHSGLSLQLWKDAAHGRILSSFSLKTEVAEAKGKEFHVQFAGTAIGIQSCGSQSQNMKTLCIVLS